MKSISMKIYISFDSGTSDEILSYIKQFEAYYTHIIIGTMPLYTEGISIIQKIKSEITKKPITAKIRLIDYAPRHAELFASLGTYALTVAAGINSTMLHAAAVATHNYGMKIFLELFDITYMNQAILDSKNFGVDGIILHYSYDPKNPQTIQEQLDFVKGNIMIPTFIDTSLIEENIQSVLAIRPEGIVITEDFIRSKNALEQFRLLHDMIMSMKS